MKRVEVAPGIYHTVEDDDPRPHVPTRAEQQQAERAQGGRRNNPSAAAPARFAPLPCIHLGAPTGELRECPTCTGKVAVKLLACALHTQCTTDKLITGVECCNICKDRTTAARPADPTSTMLLTGGLGDVIAVESFMSPEERERIETIYYACPWIAELRAIFSALPNFPNLKTHNELTPKRTYYQKSDVEAAHGPLPPLTDYSILKVFPQRRTYTGSSLLAYPLPATLPTFDKPYMVVVPTSRWGRWNDRDFSESDWQTCLGYLERHDMLGVVLFNGNDFIRDHPRLVNLQNKTNILESVETLKRAAGYMGIDSAISVLAAKLFPVKRLAIKSVWKHCYEHKHIYYAPHTDFRFLQRRIAL